MVPSITGYAQSKQSLMKNDQLVQKRNVPSASQGTWSTHRDLTLAMYKNNDLQTPW